MSSTSTTTRHPRPETMTRPSLGGLTAVELRKCVDTRAGRCLLVIIALGSVAVTVGQVFAGDESAGDYSSWLSSQGAPVGFLVPVLAILMVTSEWGARTGLGTFTLVPHRQRILSAKLAAIFALTMLAFVFSAAMTAVGTALGSVVQDVPTDWSVTWWEVLRPFIVLMMIFLVGFALALLLLNAAAAIVIFFAAQTLMPVVFTLVTSLSDIAPWIDYNTALLAMVNQETAATVQWLQLATTSAIWSLLPAAIGARRVQRAEIG